MGNTFSRICRLASLGFRHQRRPAYPLPEKPNVSPSTATRHSDDIFDTNFEKPVLESAMTQPVYNIDDPEMPAKLLHHPPGPGSFSCRFSAIPFGEPAADLTQYGQIDHECENRLEIRMPFEYHDRLFELQQAWVTKYLDNGVECIMSVGPPIPNKDYTVIIERVHTAACTGMGRELWRIPETPSEEGGW